MKNIPSNIEFNPRWFEYPGYKKATGEGVLLGDSTKVGILVGFITDSKTENPLVKEFFDHAKWDPCAYFICPEHEMSFYTLLDYFKDHWYSLKGLVIAPKFQQWALRYAGFIGYDCGGSGWTKSAYLTKSADFLVSSSRGWKAYNLGEHSKLKPEDGETPIEQIIKLSDIEWDIEHTFIC